MKKRLRVDFYMVNVEIVNTCIEHIDDIMIVENLCFRIPWSRGALIEEITRNRLATYYSAKVNDRIVGYAGMWSICGEGHITNIAVHPGYRKTGIGSKLLESLIDTAKKFKFNKMTLEVRKSNFAAQGLYKKYGFITCGIRKSYYADDGEDALIMWKYGIC